MGLVREFQSVNDFALHLAEAAVAVRLVEHHALDRAAAIIEQSAKDEIGTYQPSVGPFNGWPQLAESTQKEREHLGFTPNDPLLRTGGLRDSISREVQGLEAVVGSTSDVMVYQELGTPSIPPRPVLGPAAFKNKKKIERILGEAVVEAMEYGAAAAFVKLPA